MRKPKHRSQQSIGVIGRLDDDALGGVAAFGERQHTPPGRGISTRSRSPFEGSEARQHCRLAQHQRPAFIVKAGGQQRRGTKRGVKDPAGRLRRDAAIRARLLVVGGNGPEPDPAVTPELGRLMAIAREEGVADAVTFTGSRPREVLRNYYSAADVFVTTPWYEPFGITPLEAMGCARPVVGANVGGLKSTIVHGKTGYLVEPRDPQALAERLAALARNPALARRMGQAGRRRAASSYTWQSVVDQLEIVYRRTAARGERYQRASRQPERVPAAHRTAFYAHDRL